MQDFKENITKYNRFHTNYFNTHLFENFCHAMIKKYNKGTILYRGHISEEKGFPIEEMGCPKAIYSKDGRANAAGVECLYLANSIQTTINEVRAGIADYITIASFELLKDIWIVDLKMINRISPFTLDNFNIPLVDYIMNREYLSIINNEMSKIIRNTDSKLDYIPTQYICDYIKSIKPMEINNNGTKEIIKFSGIEYKSTLCENGDNIAIFSPDLFKGIKTEVYKVHHLNYETSKVRTSWYSIYLTFKIE